MTKNNPMNKFFEQFDEIEKKTLINFSIEKLKTNSKTK